MHKTPFIDYEMVKVLLDDNAIEKVHQLKYLGGSNKLRNCGY